MQDDFSLPVVLPDAALTRTEWMLELTNAVWSAKLGRMVGPDDVPVEFMRAGGASYVRQLAAVAAATSWSPIPSIWHTGTMVAAPRKAGAPMGATNVRGVLASSHPGKAVAKVTRARTVGVYSTVPHPGAPSAAAPPTTM